MTLWSAKSIGHTHPYLQGGIHYRALKEILKWKIIARDSNRKWTELELYGAMNKYIGKYAYQHKGILEVCLEVSVVGERCHSHSTIHPPACNTRSGQQSVMCVSVPDGGSGTETEFYISPLLKQLRGIFRLVIDISEDICGKKSELKLGICSHYLMHQV